jgi:catechol 2,3-dioxygenase-like lactoylglutathione lyase family enzyme
MSSIAAISIYVEDLEKAVEFYTKHLGFAVRSRPAPVIVELDHDNPALVLCQAERRTAYAYPAGSGTVVGIASGDVAKRATALKARGVKLVIDTPQPFPGGRFIAVQDPSGNVVELLEFEGAP